ncbi:MAG: biotin/lipoyl-binding protein, partial [Hydrogenophilales bacterium]|nr:biotin/lipoyl-binding protein [Hydrogenophilales bacterium]
MKSSHNKILIVIAAALVLAGGGMWLRHAGSGGPPANKLVPPGAGSAPPAMTVRVAEVKSAALREDVTAIGTLLANESITIRSEVDGRITQIHFREGEPVARGAKLVSLNSAETEAQLRAALADTTLNRTRLTRAEELHGKNFISGQALDEAREHLN